MASIKVNHYETDSKGRFSPGDKERLGEIRMKTMLKIMKR